MDGNGTAIALRPSGHLQIDAGQDFWTPEQIAALQVLGIKGATNGDLAVYFHYCRRTQLDPFSRQIYMIRRREKVDGQWVDKQTIQVGIDGFRVIRDRAARRDGVTVDYEDTIWYDGDGSAHAVWLSPEPPAGCKVVLVKHTPTGDLRYPGVLRTAAYMATRDGRPVSQWATQPEHMIEKCCEAFANRRGFPHDLSGVYIEEELNGRQPGQRERPPRVTAAQILSDDEPEQVPLPDPPGTAANGTQTASRDRPRRPSKGELAARDNLTRIMASLPLSPPATREKDWHDILTWICGEDWAATPGQVADAVAGLEDYLSRTGDPEEAVTEIWAAYTAATEDGEL